MGNNEIFQRMASVYDTPDRIEQTKEIAEAIRPYIIGGKQKVAMDYGCGTGLVGLNLIDEFQKVIFLDSSENMIRVVNEKLKTHGIENGVGMTFDLEVGNEVQDLDQKLDRSQDKDLDEDRDEDLVQAKEHSGGIGVNDFEMLDFIFMSQVLLHIQNPAPVIDKLAARLRVGGRMVIVDFDRNARVQSDLVHPGFTPDEMKVIVEAGGLRLMEQKTFLQGEKIFMNEDASLFVLCAEK